MAGAGRPPCYNERMRQFWTRRAAAPQLWKHHTSSLLIPLGAALALLLLAAVQYQLVSQVSQGERERMRESTRLGTLRFSEDFDRELARAYFSFRMDVTTLRERAWGRYAQRYVHWVTSAPYPKLVKSVFLVDTDAQGALRVARFTPSASRFEPTGWSGDIARLRERFEQAHRSTRRAGDALVGGAVDQLADDIPALIIRVPRRWQVSDQSTPAFDADVLADDGMLLWLQRRCVGCKQSAETAALFAYTVVVLDRSYIQHDFAPTLARRHFARDAQLDYQVAIASRTAPGDLIYRSEPGEPVPADGGGDARAGVFSLRVEEFSGLLLDSALRLYHPDANLAEQPISIVRPLPSDPPADGPPPGADGRWELVVTHRAGSLEAAVERLRRQNLLISFSSLLLLSLGLGLVLVSTRRSLRLARQQMEFVTAVSHELRTPLAVIYSAGDNLAAGVVHDPLQAQRYGEVIRGEGQRLAQMVEQVLEFAGAQSGRQTYQIGPIDAGQLIAGAVAACRPQLEGQGFTLETHIPPHLPVVQADAAALGRSIQNLIINAIKYSGGQRWIAVRARVARGQRGPELLISVQDRGLGIAPADLPHIFEPFYRCPDVVAAQISGSGLGLRLVKQTVEAHGGRVSVESAPGQGSTFTLHLPCQASIYARAASV